ncbi:hypothetical protein TIFTF001_021905 [Ficus carica]|uniref:Ubiquitin thioesterase OTU n=1 Tax=Ficus carica TaxID=3494 RepID=A0AA88AIC4_FICCA|nr:hypothetical protein TIFTF001_021905 [Ficus carica]
MLAVLCARSKPRILSSFLSSLAHGSAVHHNLYLNGRFISGPVQFADGYHRRDDAARRRRHSSACQLGAACGGAASIWHAILPSSGGGLGVGGGRRFDRRRPAAVHFDQLKGEGSWNAALDARPARWLHRADSAWLLFGVCACLAPATLEIGCVLADGRCLFRAIAHVACLRNGEEAPDESRQRELADELRAQVVNELLKRREQSEWFIEGDFDAYVKNIQQPYVWGGEPELLMASHVLKTPIWVFMRDGSTGGLVNIAKYGEEYGKEEENPINVLFHGYGHYDILETPKEKQLSQTACVVG